MRLCALVLACFAGFGQSRLTPTYTEATILNSASGLPDAYSPNTLLAIHGLNLATTRADVDLQAVRSIPTVFMRTQVYIRNFQAGIISVAPDQLLVMTPGDLIPGVGNLQVVVDGRAGPAVPIRVRTASPGLFMRAEGMAAATRSDGFDITPEAPAIPGELVTFYATGLGPTRPAVDGLTILRRLAPLTRPLQVLLDGTAINASAIEYAGVYPDLVGTYLIRCRLPPVSVAEPEIRLLVDGQFSQEGVRVPVASVVAGKLSTSIARTSGSPGATSSSAPWSIRLSSSPTRK
jgi:uncharacterized protein (TIGR03437 family)